MVSTIEDVTKEVRDLMYRTYVESAKVQEIWYNNYFEVIRQKLTAEFVRDDGQHYSFYDALKERTKALSRKQYESAHKGKIEYLYQLSQKRLIARAKREL